MRACVCTCLCMRTCVRARACVHAHVCTRALVSASGSVILLFILKYVPKKLMHALTVQSDCKERHFTHVVEGRHQEAALYTRKLA